jgi:hypothetical protein
MEKRRRRYKFDLLSLNFRVGHACPKATGATDWTNFRLIEVDSDLSVFQCPCCKVHACIDLHLATTQHANIRRWKR